MSARASMLVCMATVAWCAGVAGLAGCGTDSTAVNPVPTPTASTTQPQPDSGVPDAAEADVAVPEAGGPVVRTVIQRSALGQLDPDNLLRDGDFELSGPDAMQYAWLGLLASDSRIGATCRSGVRCISLDPGNYTYTTIVWPTAPSVELSFYASVEGDDCEAQAAGVVLMADSDAGPSFPIAAETAAPVDGWCRFRDTINVPANPGYHYWILLLAARQSASAPSVFDEAAMHAITTGNAGAAVRKLTPLAPDVLSVTAKARDALRKRLPVDPTPRLPVRNPTGRKPR